MVDALASPLRRRGPFRIFGGGRSLERGSPLSPALPVNVNPVDAGMTAAHTLPSSRPRDDFMSTLPSSTPAHSPPSKASLRAWWKQFTGTQRFKRVDATETKRA